MAIADVRAGAVCDTAPGATLLVGSDESVGLEAAGTAMAAR